MASSAAQPPSVPPREDRKVFDPDKLPKDNQGLIDWIRENGIEDVECLFPDLAGVARGKILPADRFISSLQNKGLRIPENVFVQTVSGYFAEPDWVTDPSMPDVYMIPDPQTVRWVPWYNEPTAQVICDCEYIDGSPVGLSARTVLAKVLKLYADKGIRPIVAPELEFFIVEQSDDPDQPLKPPVGRSGRRETSRQAFGIDAVNEFDPLFEDVYDFCERQGVSVDTLSHEGGAAQMEMNFGHGDALALADQAFLFKRTVREAALRHKVFATFMAKPMAGEPGSSMHVHLSLTNAENGKNLFADGDGENTPLFMNFIAGQQRYLPAVMPLLAPNVNSYRRFVAGWDAPINTHWGIDNRTVGLRVPISDGKSRRVENRVAGADANPYLALAGSLACGYLGIVEGLEPSPVKKGNAYNLAHTLPRTLYDALDKFKRCTPLKELLGEPFMNTVQLVREAELEDYQSVISSWEREHLLLNV